MKIKCDECKGEGTIPCPECYGAGTWIGNIESMRLERSMKNYDELAELQKDANRVIKQAGRLKEIKPHRKESYEAQLRATLFVINAQAEKVSK